MFGKAILFAVLFALCRGQGEDEICPVTSISINIEQAVCGTITILRYKNCTIISVQRELYENTTYTVVEMNGNDDACYVIQNSDVAGSAPVFEEIADVDVANDIRSKVPECQGRTIYIETTDNGSELSERRKRQVSSRCRYCLFGRIRCNGRLVWVRLCRIVPLPCAALRG